MKISIPKPCQENWNTMTPNEKGRFCLSCNKTVVDFSRMKKDEIVSYLENQNKVICGRVRIEDLLNIRTLPHHESYSKKYFLQPKFSLSRLFVMTMGLLFLYSCDNPNFEKNEDDINQKEDSSSTDLNRVLLGDTVLVNDSMGHIEDDEFMLRKIRFSKPKNKESIKEIQEHEQFENPVLMGLIPPPEIVDPDPAYSDIQPRDPEPASFLGGEAALQDFITRHLAFDPIVMAKGLSYAKIVINSDGSIGKTVILRSLSPENDAEIKRVISLMPSWIPSQQNGKNFKSEVVVAFKFG